MAGEMCAHVLHRIAQDAQLGARDALNVALVWPAYAEHVRRYRSVWRDLYVRHGTASCAARHNRVQVLLRMMSEQRRSYTWRGVLKIAMAHGSQQSAKAIIDNVYAEGRGDTHVIIYAYIHAVRTDNIELVDYIHAQCAPLVRKSWACSSAFFIAALDGRREIIERLLERNEMLRSQEVLQEAVSSAERGKHTELAEWLREQIQKDF